MNAQVVIAHSLQTGFPQGRLVHRCNCKFRNSNGLNYFSLIKKNSFYVEPHLGMLIKLMSYY